MFLGAKIIDSFLDGTLPTKCGQYNRWIERFESDLWSRTQNLTHDEAQIRLVDSLEVRLCFWTSHNIRVYANYSLPFSKLESQAISTLINYSRIWCQSSSKLFTLIQLCGQASMVPPRFLLPIYLLQVAAS